MHAAYYETRLFTYEKKVNYSCLLMYYTFIAVFYVLLYLLF